MGKIFNEKIIHRISFEDNPSKFEGIILLFLSLPGGFSKSSTGCVTKG